MRKVISLDPVVLCHFIILCVTSVSVFPVTLSKRIYPEVWRTVRQNQTTEIIWVNCALDTLRNDLYAPYIIRV